MSCDEWKKFKLGNVLTPNGYIRGPFGSSLRRGELKDSGIPVYEQQHAIYGSRSFRFYIDNEKYEELKRFTIKPGDLIISCSGTIGKISMISEADPKGIISQALLILRCDPNIIDKNYLYQYLSSEQGYQSIISRSTGSVQVNIAKRDIIEKIPLLLPSLPEQKVIAATLSCLDDKIELNNKISDNLAEMAQALYNKYFIANKDLSNVCHTGILGDICSYSSKKVCVKDLSIQRYISTENMLSNKCGVTEATNLPTGSQTTKFEIGDTLVSNIRPYFKKLFYCIFEGGCSTDVLCFVPHKPELSVYLYCTLYTDGFFDYMMSGSKGTKMPRGDKRQIMNYPIEVPNNDYLKSFVGAVTPMLTLQATIAEENKKFASVRDTLLPKLMSGEIRVPVGVE